MNFHGTGRISPDIVEVFLFCFRNAIYYLFLYIINFFGSDDSQQESFVLNVSGINFYKMKIIINNKLKLHVLQKSF